MQDPPKDPHILILGGGMAGVEAAITLASSVVDPTRITLISERDFLYVYPAAIWLTVGKRTLEDLSLPLPQLADLHGFTFRQEAVLRIHSQSQTVTTSAATYAYDALIIALGSAKEKPPGAEHYFSICGTPEEGLHIQERFLALAEQGSGSIACGFSGNPLDSTAVRGGPVFEVLFNFDTYLRQRGIRDQFVLTFFSPAVTPGHRLGAAGLATRREAPRSPVGVSLPVGHRGASG